MENPYKTRLETRLKNQFTKFKIYNELKNKLFIIGIVFVKESKQYNLIKVLQHLHTNHDKCCFKVKNY